METRTRRSGTHCRNGPRWKTLGLLGGVVVALVGCRFEADWPESPHRTRIVGSRTQERSYRINGAQRVNYRQRFVDGRATQLVFERAGEQAGPETEDLLGAHPEWPHFIIVLDGIPFDLVAEMYSEGRFRLFAPPARVISVFPAMTDVALSRLFDTTPCLSIEALFFDRRRNALSNGKDVYLSGANAPWTDRVTYHAPQRVAVGTYLDPWPVVSTELRAMQRLFRETSEPSAIAYAVGTAGIGTRQGEQGLRAVLVEVDKLCERITYDRRGRVRLSIVADHGHGLEPCRRVSFRRALTEAGFRVGKSINGPDDVVIVGYGLITCAVLHTDRPQAVAAVLRHQSAVDLVMFRDADRVFVQNAEASATIERRDGGFAYDTANGDPLELGPILEKLAAAGHIGPDGTVADRHLLQATARHRYPDPLHRIWWCFDGLVSQPADVVVSLEPDACHGSKFFHFFVAPVASTHGGLDAGSSVTCLLTNVTAGPLPDVMRIEDVMPFLASCRPDRERGNRAATPVQ